jgi:hypothetical protein
MEKYCLDTNILVEVDIPSYRSSSSSSDEGYSTEESSTDMYSEFGRFPELGIYLKDVLDKLNDLVKIYGFEFITKKSTLSNSGTDEKLFICSDKEIEISLGYTAMVISFNDDGKLLVITVDPLKVYYAMNVKEFDFEPVGKVSNDIITYYVYRINKLQSVPKDILKDLNSVMFVVNKYRFLVDNAKIFRLVIKYINSSKDIKNKDLITKALERIILLYRKMINDIPYLKDIKLNIDLHSENWKFVVSNNEKKLIAIDPFIAFVNDPEIFKELEKDVVKNFKDIFKSK